jgi:hypothetical protein
MGAAPYLCYLAFNGALQELGVPVSALDRIYAGTVILDTLLVRQARFKSLDLTGSCSRLCRKLL